METSYGIIADLHMRNHAQFQYVRITVIDNNVFKACF